MAGYASYVGVELQRAERLVSEDHKQRWVTLDGVIHEAAVPYRDAFSIRWMPIVAAVAINYRDRALAHPAC